MLVREDDGLLSVGGFDNNLESFSFKESFQTATDWRVVVCQQDAQRH